MKLYLGMMVLFLKLRIKLTCNSVKGCLVNSKTKIKNYVVKKINKTYTAVLSYLLLVFVWPCTKLLMSVNSLLSRTDHMKLFLLNTN